MADYHTHLCFAFEADTKEAELFEKLAEWDFEEVGKNPEWPNPENMSPEDFADMIDPYGNGLMGLGVGVKLEQHPRDHNITKVTVSDDGGQPSLDDLIAFLKFCFKKTTATKPIVIQWASTCTATRVDAFGGGVSVIQKGRDTTINTSELPKLLMEMSKHVYT